jgi:hypothetical protein
VCKWKILIDLIILWERVRKMFQNHNFLNLKYDQLCFKFDEYHFLFDYFKFYVQS